MSATGADFVLAMPRHQRVVASLHGRGEDEETSFGPCRRPVIPFQELS